MRTPRLPLFLALLALLLGGLLVSPPPSRAAAGWTPGAAMGAARVWHTATPLPNGTVLVAGGYTTPGAPLATAERYDPATGAWSPAAPMHYARLGHAAAALADGRVLIVGGQAYPDGGSATAEVYDPASDAWTLVAPLAGPRERPTATPLADGRVLVAGGSGAINLAAITAAAEIFDPATGRWTPGGALTTGRFWHTATRLTDGTVLVVGGLLPVGSPGCPPAHKVPCPTAAAERYDPAANAWDAVASTATPHGYGHTATLLPDGQVLVVGGWPLQQAAERYDPGTGRWRGAGTPPPSGLEFAREEHTATLLPGGLVLVAGGGETTPTAATALYDAARDTWRAGPALATGRNRHTATRLRDGRVLVTGGGGAGPPSP